MKRKEDLDMYYAFEPKILKNIKPATKSQVIHEGRLNYDSFGNSKDKVASLGAERRKRQKNLRIPDLSLELSEEEKQIDSYQN